MFQKFRVLLIVLAAVFAILSFIFFQDNQDRSIQDIHPPETSIAAIEGTWKIKNVNTDNMNEAKPIDKSTKFYISKELVAFGEHYTMNPSIKSKFVSMEKYFADKYKLENKDVKTQKPIYTIYDETRFSQDFILYDKNSLILAYNGRLYELERTSEFIDPAILNKYSKMYEENNGQNEFRAISEDLGLQIGVRQKSESGVTTYRTYYIKLPKTGNPIVYLAENIVFQRDDGLWTARYENKNEKKQLVVEPFIENMKPSVDHVLTSVTPMEITYLDANFISLAHQMSGSYVYRFYHLDHLKIEEAYSLLNISGEEGQSALDDVLAEKTFSDTENQNMTISDYKNIGVKRSEGRWNFVTNLIDEVNKSQETLQTKDLKLSIVPKIDVRMEEEKSPPKWIDIKNLSQDAIDAYFSPNKNVLIVQTTDELLIYKAQDKTKPIATIPFSKNDRIVMCQWALDKYADIWEKEFSKTPRLPVSYNTQ